MKMVNDGKKEKKNLMKNLSLIFFLIIDYYKLNNLCKFLSSSSKDSNSSGNNRVTSFPPRRVLCHLHNLCHNSLCHLCDFGNLSSVQRLPGPGTSRIPSLQAGSSVHGSILTKGGSSVLGNVRPSGQRAIPWCFNWGWGASPSIVQSAGSGNRRGWGTPLLVRCWSLSKNIFHILFPFLFSRRLWERPFCPLLVALFQDAFIWLNMFGLLSQTARSANEVTHDSSTQRLIGSLCHTYSRRLNYLQHKEGQSEKILFLNSKNTSTPSRKWY